MESVWKAWPRLKKRITSSKHRLLMLDFDGTLAKIARTPSEVVLENRAQDVLAMLGGSAAYRLAIVSGRSLKDLRSYFHAKKIIYVGNHGLELNGRGLSLPARARTARKLEALIWLLGQKLKDRFSGASGVLIEDKGFTLSFHYRNVGARHLPGIQREILRFKREFAHWPIVWKSGKMVWEARPAVRWGKGEIALYLSRRHRGSLPIVIGDDVTDEDMFRALGRRAITIRVGRSRSSSANYYLGSTREVVRLLRRLSAL